MTGPVQALLHNQLLRNLSPDAFQTVASSLQLVDLPKRHELVKAGVPSPWAYFPESGLMAITSMAPGGQELEIGVFGREGMGSTAFVLGCDATPHGIYMQMAGQAHRIPVTALWKAMDESSELRSLLLRYTQVFIVQVTQTALANARYTIEQRLARWLLMAHDRTSGDDLALTHQLLSIMLGVRRSGITLATHVLEGENMIHARRGIVGIKDRAKLVALAGQSYGVAEVEYEHLIGPLRPGLANGTAAESTP